MPYARCQPPINRVGRRHRYGLAGTLEISVFHSCSGLWPLLLSVNNNRHKPAPHSPRSQFAAATTPLVTSETGAGQNASFCPPTGHCASGVGRAFSSLPYDDLIIRQRTGGLPERRKPGLNIHVATPTGQIMQVVDHSDWSDYASCGVGRDGSRSPSKPKSKLDTPQRIAVTMGDVM